MTTPVRFPSVDSTGRLREKHLPQRALADMRRNLGVAGRIVFIVDDAHATHLTVAAPKIEAVGGRMNFAIPISSLNSGGVTMVSADVTTAYQRGHQIMSHSMTHPNMTTQTAAQRTAEWDDSKAALEALTAVGAITDFVMPNNASNLTTQQEAYLRYQRVFTAQQAPTIFAPGENGLHIGRNTWSTVTHQQFLAQIRRIAVTGETYIIFTHSVITADSNSSINQTMFDEAIALAASVGVQWVRADEALIGHQPILDAGFESGDLTYHSQVAKAGTSTIDIVTDTPATGLPGTKSLRIVGDGTGQNILTVGTIGIVCPRPAEEYTASCRMRQDKTSGTGGGTLLIRQWDEFGNNLGDVNTTPNTTVGVTAWAQVSIAFVPNKLTRSMSVRCMQTAPGMVGTTWFDHVHVAPTRYGVLG